MKSFQHSLVGFDFGSVAANLLPEDREELDRILETGIAVDSIAIFIHEAYTRKLAAEAEAHASSNPSESISSNPDHSHSRHI